MDIEKLENRELITCNIPLSFKEEGSERNERARWLSRRETLGTRRSLKEPLKRPLGSEAEVNGALNGNTTRASCMKEEDVCK